MKWTLVLLLMAGWDAALADDIVGVVATPQTISVLTLRPVKSFDSDHALAYSVESGPGGKPRIVQIYFDATLVESGGMDLTNFKCLSSTGTFISVDLDGGSPDCGMPPLKGGKSRDVTLMLPAMVFGNASKPIDETATVSYVKPLFGPLSLQMRPGKRALFISAAPDVSKELLDALAAHASELELSFKFDPADDPPSFPLKVTAVGPSAKGEPGENDTAGSYIKVSLPALLPSRPNKYKVTLSINKNLLPQDISQRIDPDATALKIGATVPASTTPDRDHSDFYLDMTFTSYVNPFNPNKPPSPSNNGQRRNVGLFALTYKPELGRRSWGLSSSKAQQWLYWNPYLIADVSTLPLKEAKAPTQIVDGLDLVYGRSVGTTGLKGFLFTIGGRHESDRDLKFQIAEGRFTAAPLIAGWVDSRAHRDQLALNQGKKFLVTAYSFQPKVGYEIGDVLRDRPQRLLDNANFQDYISRLLVDFAMSVEFRKFLTFSASDEYYYHWTIDRRPQRNYLEAKLDFNAGYLFRRFGSRALSYGIMGKFQRGEQSPAFTPVNVFSLGITFVR